MEFKDTFKYYWIILVTVLVFFFWLGFFISENIYNQNSTYYSISIESNDIDIDDITVDFFLKALEKKDADGKVIGYSYETVKPRDFFSKNDILITSENEKINVRIKASYFIGSDEVAISSKSQERFMKVIKKVTIFYDEEALINGVNVKEFNDYNSLEITNYINPYFISIITLVVGFLIYCIVMFFIKDGLTIPDDKIYESGKIFKHPFTAKYWEKAINSIKKMKTFDMCLISILFALQMILKFISLPSGFATLGLGFTYLVFAYICLIYGPIWGLVIGFGSDIFGFIIKPTIFHPGYTLQAMLTGFVYGLFLYKTDLKFSKIILCRIVINIIINGIFGSFLWGSYAKLNHEATIAYMNFVSLPKNIIYLIPQSALLYFFLRLATPMLAKRNIIPKEVIELKDDFA